MGEWRVSQVRRGWVMGKVDDWDWELYGFSNAKRRSSYCLHRSGIFYVAFCLIMTELARRLQ